MDDYEISPYNMGWRVGYDDQENSSACPFALDTEEYKEWMEGYEQGCMDC